MKISKKQDKVLNLQKNFNPLSKTPTTNRSSINFKKMFLKNYFYCSLLKTLCIPQTSTFT